MSRKIIVLSLFSALILGCSAPKEPEFKRMQNTIIQKLSVKEIIIQTDAVFDNPNGFGVTVSSIDLLAKANDVEAAKIRQMDDVDMIGYQEFAIPLEIQMKPIELMSLGNILKLVAGSLEQKVTLNYKGSIKVRIMDIGYNIPIDYSEEILLK